MGTLSETQTSVAESVFAPPCCQSWKNKYLEIRKGRSHLKKAVDLLEKACKQIEDRNVVLYKEIFNLKRKGEDTAFHREEEIKLLKELLEKERKKAAAKKKKAAARKRKAAQASKKAEGYRIKLESFNEAKSKFDEAIKQLEKAGDLAVEVE